MTSELFSEKTTNYAIGLILAVSSCFFIGSSFIIKKKALIKSGLTGKRAAKGGYAYLREFQWWCGLISMATGEILNLSIVLHAPKEGEIDGLRTLGRMIISNSFINYLIFISIVSIILVYYYAPKYGENTVVIYVLICSLIGSLSVMACKGIGIAIVETVNGVENNFKNPLFYFLLALLAFTVTVQMNYLNKALDTFDTFVVTPVYYVFFTTFVLIASAILFQEWLNLEVSDIIGTLSGFVNVIVAIFMLNAFKNHDSNLDEIITSISKPKYELIADSECSISLKS